MQSQAYGYHVHTYDAACGAKFQPCPEASISVSRSSSQSCSDLWKLSEQSCDSDYFSAYKADAREQEDAFNDENLVRDQAKGAGAAQHVPQQHHAPAGQLPAPSALECGERLASADASALAAQPALKRAGISDPELRALIRAEREKEREGDLRVDDLYLRFHDETVSADKYISANMRTIAFGWLVEVCIEFRLQQETLFLAIRLADRFLSNAKAVPRNMLQLVAVTCVLLASKQEEEVCPTVEQLCDIAANCFKAEDVLRMELLVLDTLLWRTKMPTSYTFLHLFAQALPFCTYNTVCLASYLLELALLEYGSLQFEPSAQAAAALMVAQIAQKQQPSCELLCSLSGHSLELLKESADLLMRLHYVAWGATEQSPAQPMAAVRSKYDQPAFCHASRLPPAAAYSHLHCRSR